MSREDHEDWLPFDSGTMPSIEEDEDRKKAFVDGLSKLSRTTMEKLFDHFENFFGKRGMESFKLNNVPAESIEIIDILACRFRYKVEFVGKSELVISRTPDSRIPARSEVHLTDRQQKQATPSYTAPRIMMKRTEATPMAEKQVIAAPVRARALDPRSVEQREEDYERAKNRIFSERDRPPQRSPPPSRTPPPQQQQPRKPPQPLPPPVPATWSEGDAAEPVLAGGGVLAFSSSDNYAAAFTPLEPAQTSGPSTVDLMNAAAAIEAMDDPDYDRTYDRYAPRYYPGFFYPPPIGMFQQAFSYDNEFPPLP